MTDAMATFYALCMDTDDGDRLGRFWAETVGCRFRPDGGIGGDVGSVAGDEEYQTIVMCRVPEPRTVKHRVHLDVYARSIEELTARGATVVLPAEESGFGWTTMRDPEGGDFCAFLREEPPPYRLHGVVVDCADPERVARWWGEVFGREPRGWDEGPWWTLEHVTPDEVLTFDFNPVPEPKTVKNRIHWDVRGDLAALEAHGATRLWEQERWTTLADPEGNEFCVFPPAH